MANHLLEAARLRAYARRASALASLEVYFRKSVGIGEHPQHNEEIDKLIEEAASADDAVQLLSAFDKGGRVADALIGKLERD